MTSPLPPPVDALRVVVPARDEADAIGVCLAALAVAVDRLRETHPGVSVGPGTGVLVVADRCTDPTAEWARAAGAAVVRIEAGSVGTARQYGTALALRETAGVPRTRTWLAATDADSAVPPDWLVAHVETARTHDVHVGTVVLDDVAGAASRARWQRSYSAREGHPHVHGANLGVRADAYLRAGGWRPSPAHEDVALVADLEATGARVLRTAREPVRTSGRRRGRAPEGVAHWLARAEVAEAG